jgi:hypothetical protein
MAYVPKNSLRQKEKPGVLTSMPVRKRKPMSEEHRKRLSESLKGKRAWNKGRRMGPMSEEHRRRISEALRDKPKSAAHKQRISEAMRRIADRSKKEAH